MSDVYAHIVSVCPSSVAECCRGCACGGVSTCPPAASSWTCGMWRWAPTKTGGWCKAALYVHWMSQGSSWTRATTHTLRAKSDVWESDSRQGVTAQTQNVGQARSNSVHPVTVGSAAAAAVGGSRAAVATNVSVAGRRRLSRWTRAATPAVRARSDSVRGPTARARNRSDSPEMSDGTTDASTVLPSYNLGITTKQGCGQSGAAACSRRPA